MAKKKIEKNVSEETNDKVKALKDKIDNIVNGKEKVSGKEELKTIKISSAKAKSNVKADVEFVKEHNEYINACAEVFIKHKIPKEDHPGIISTVCALNFYKKHGKKYKVDLDTLKKDYTAKYNLTAKALKEILDVLNTYSEFMASALSNLSHEERREKITSIIEMTMKDDGTLTDKKTDTSTDKKKSVGVVQLSSKTGMTKDGLSKEDQKEFKDKTGIDFDPKKHKTMSFYGYERIGMYPALLEYTEDIERDRWCDYADDPKELAKHNKPMHTKLVNKDVSCLIGKEAILMPIFNMPLTTIILPKDLEDDDLTDPIEFREPCSINSSTELFKSKPYLEKTAFKGKISGLPNPDQKAVTYFFPWCIDGLVNPPIIAQEDGYFALSSTILNDRGMPTDENHQYTTDEIQHVDTIASVTGMQLHDWVLRALCSSEDQGKKLEDIILERLCRFDTFNPVVTGGKPGYDVIDSLKLNVISTGIRTKCSDLSILISLGIIDPYENLKLSIEFKDQPCETKLLISPCDDSMDKDELYKSIQRVTRLTHYEPQDRSNVINKLDVVTESILELARDHRENGSMVDIIRYTYNFLHTFRVCLEIDANVIENVKTAVKVLKDNKVGNNEFIITSEAIDSIINLLEKVIEEGEGLYPITGSMITRATGVGLGVIKHNFVPIDDKK